MTAEEIEPEKWALELWHAADDAAAECARDEAGYPNYAAAIVIQRAFEERERKLREAIIAQPSGDEVEAVARHLCEREIIKAYTRPDRADELKEFRKIEVDHLWENYKDLATAAIAALDAHRGKQ